MNRSRWSADELRDRVRACVSEALAGPDGVLVIEETGFVKKGPDRTAYCPLCSIDHRPVRTRVIPR
ncbi:transposase [Nocardia sp. CA-107356]|uniref:transposase n=1 Tax=Nocardia sp. CA-107356 TaxID=3239972 RepID=UPI003D925EF1